MPLELSQRGISADTTSSEGLLRDLPAEVFASNLATPVVIYLSKGAPHQRNVPLRPHLPQHNHPRLGDLDLDFFLPMARTEREDRAGGTEKLTAVVQYAFF